MHIIFKESLSTEEKTNYEIIIQKCLNLFIKNSTSGFDSNYQNSLQEITLLMNQSLNPSDEYLYLDAIQTIAKHKKSLLFHFESILRNNLDEYLYFNNHDSIFNINKFPTNLHMIDNQQTSYEIDIKPFEELIWSNVFEYSNNISYILHAILQNEKNPFDYRILAHSFVLSIKRLNKPKEVEKLILLAFKPTISSFVINLYKEIHDEINIIKVEKISVVIEDKTGVKTFVQPNNLSTFDLKIDDLKIPSSVTQSSTIEIQLNKIPEQQEKPQEEYQIYENIHENVNKFHPHTTNFPFPTIDRSTYEPINALNASTRETNIKKYKEFFMNLITLNHELEITRESMENNDSISLQQLLAKKEQRIINNLEDLIKEYLTYDNSSYLLLSEDFYNEIISFKTYLINIDYNLKEKSNLKFQDLIQNEEDSFNLVIDSILPTFPIINSPNNNLTVFDEYNLQILSKLIQSYSKNNSYPIFLKHNLDRLQLTFLYESLKYPLFYIQKNHNIIKIMNSLFNLNSLFSFAYQEKVTNKIKKFLDKTNIYDKDLDYLLQKIESINLDYKNYENKIVEKFTKTQHLEILLNETYDTTFKFLFNYFEKSNNVVYKFLLERIWGYYFTHNYKNQIKQDPQFFKNPGLETKIFLNQSILLFDMLAWMYNFNNTTGFQNDSLDKINLYKNKIPENWNKISIQLGIPNEINEIVLDCLNTRLSLINPLDAEEIKNLVIKTHSVEKNLILNLDKKIPNVPEIKKKIVKALHDSKEKNIDLLSYLELNNWFELTDSKNLVLKLHLIYVDNVNYIYLFNSPNNNKTYKFDLYRIWSFYKNNNLQKLNIKFVPEEFSMLINKAILQTSVLK